MKLMRFIKNQTVYYGELKGEQVLVLAGSLETGFTYTGENFELNDVKILSPVSPSKIVCIGLNYMDHIIESKETPPETPVMFLKPPTTVIGHGDRIYYPDMSKQVEYERELAVVIGQTTTKIAEEDAFKHILGYTCANDVTARDLQPFDGQWTIAKGFDTFLPIGPCIVTNIEADNLSISTELNGKIVQNSSTKHFLFKVPMLISYISHIMTLLPGDVVLTGTSSGVGPMSKGDCVTVKIENIGALKNIIE